MPAGRYSRYTLCDVLADEHDRLFLGDRSRYTYRELPDNVFHQVKEGDTLFNLAAAYFQGAQQPALLYWVIADFQPEPIYDPTLALEPGRVLVIPSLRTVMEQILNPARRAEFLG